MSNYSQPFYLLALVAPILILLGIEYYKTVHQQTNTRLQIQAELKRIQAEQEEYIKNNKYNPPSLPDPADTPVSPEGELDLDYNSSSSSDLHPVDTTEEPSDV